MKNRKFIKESGNFKLYIKGIPYKALKGFIYNKKTCETFEGEIILYKYFLNNEWIFDEDIYEARPYPPNFDKEEEKINA